MPRIPGEFGLADGVGMFAVTLQQPVKSFQAQLRLVAQRDGETRDFGFPALPVCRAKNRAKHAALRIRICDAAGIAAISNASVRQPGWCHSPA